MFITDLFLCESWNGILSWLTSQIFICCTYYVTSAAVSKVLYKEKQKENAQQLEIIEKLKKAKDKEDVEFIEREYVDSSFYDDFEELSEKVSACLSPIDGKIAAFAFADYSGKKIVIDVEGYDSEIADAISNDYLSNDLEVDWDTTQLMKELYSALEKLKGHMEEYDEEIRNEFSKNYKVTFSIYNLGFWKKVFGRNIFI